MRKFALLVVFALGACTTTQLQTEATRLAAINTILCSAGAKAQPVAVALASTIVVAANPADAGAVAAAVAVDNTIHAQLQAACPAGTQFLQALATVPATPTPTTATP